MLVVYKIMILVRMMGGLGNQMFQYALGRRLALRYGVSLKLDLSWFETQSLRRYQLDLFQVEAEIASPQEVSEFRRSSWGGLPGRVFRGIQRRLPVHLRRHVREQHYGFDAQILRAGCNAYLDGYWQSERYFEEIADMIRREFKLHLTLSPKAQSLAQAMQVANSVSLHVRRGDYARDPRTHQVHGVCPPEYYRRAAETIHERVARPVYYIFSDEIQWARQNLDFLDPAIYVQLDSPERDVEELVLMSFCQHHIIANSSYSWWGAWLGRNPDKIVIAPQKWFAQPGKVASEMIPAAWVAI